MNSIKFIFCLSGICLITVYNNIGFAKSSLHIQRDETKTNKTKSGLSVVQFYENTLALYIEEKLAYSTSELPSSLFELLTGCSQKDINKSSVNFLTDIIYGYLIAVKTHQIPRSAEIEAILINHLLMKDEGDDKVINSINRRIGPETGIKIRIYSDSEINDISDNLSHTIFPSGNFEDLSSYPICSIDSYSPELISYIYENGIHNLKKCVEFLNKVKPSDMFFNVHDYYSSKLNLLLFKTWNMLKKEKYTENQWELFYSIPLSSIEIEK